MAASPRLSCARLRWLAASLVAAGPTVSYGAQVPDPKGPQCQNMGKPDRSCEIPGTADKIAYHLYVPTPH
jgi:hypothetical protein